MYNLLSQDSEDFGFELILHFNTTRVGKYAFEFYICSYLELKILERLGEESLFLVNQKPQLRSGTKHC